MRAFPCLATMAPKNTTEERISRIRLSGISYCPASEASTVTLVPSCVTLHPRWDKILMEVSTSDSLGQLCSTLGVVPSNVAESSGKALFLAPCTGIAPTSLWPPCTISFDISSTPLYENTKTNHEVSLANHSMPKETGV